MTPPGLGGVEESVRILNRGHEVSGQGGAAVAWTVARAAARRRKRGHDASVHIARR